MSSEQAPYAVQRNPTDPTRLKRALTYLRVSTGRQLDTAIDIDPDGLSIHTQRKFAEHKVESLDAYTVMEFIEPGNSAKNVEDRPVFRELLNYLMEHRDIDYVVVYMRSRAFRNHFDAAIVGRQLEKIGVRLVSAKEDFGEGPNAVAMEGMLDIMNGWVNTIQGLDIQAKMYEKAKAGGTLGRPKSATSTSSPTSRVARSTPSLSTRCVRRLCVRDSSCTRRAITRLTDLSSRWPILV